MYPLLSSISVLRRPLCEWVTGFVLVLGLVSSGCTSFQRSLNMPNAFKVRSEGRPELEKRVRENIRSFLVQSEFRTRGLSFDGDVVVRTVAVKKKDRLGVPYWKERTQGRVGGITLFTGKHLPIVIAIATIDGKWDDRTLRHECAHAILLWNDIKGHPRQYRSVAPLWY